LQLDNSLRCPGQRKQLGVVAPGSNLRPTE